MSAANPDTVIGRLIDDRYQVRSLIARGGMATVYVATDVRLERRVAIKIMHDHLAADEAFRARFIREARAAAKLAHPNLVNVYDQGEDGPLAYMVMEYVPGITLRDLLHDHHRLTVEQTIDIMDAVLAGLQVAHRQGIVHRDIKPENVLLADDGRIKLSDFGLARAATSNTASGSVLLGTIAYLAPELVTKGTADVRSDIYSAGIMMFEMLAGEQPYRGDEPVNIAYRHANDSVPPPSELQPDVPQELDDLVVWATERDPDDRPADAGAMLAALRQAERDIAAGGGTRVAPAAAAPPADDPSTKLLAVADDDRGEHGWLATEATDAHELRAAAAPAGVPAGGFAPAMLPTLPPGAHRLERVNRHKRRSGWVAALVVALLVALAGGIGWWEGIGPGSYDPVPQVVGLERSEAETAIVAAGFAVGAVDEEHTLEAPAGTVLRTDPEAGIPFAPGTSISLVVSAGPRVLTVPALAGLGHDEAIEAIEQAGFVHDEGTERSEFSAEAPAGTVLYGTTADGAALPTEMEEAQPIRLVLSAGQVPDVVGEGESVALDRLVEAGLVGEIIHSVHSSTAPAGVVVEQRTTTDPVRPGDTIELITSLGPDLVEVPNVVGKPLEEAIATLEEAGFTVDHEVPSYLVDRATVSKIEPGAGTEIERGGAVKLSATFTL
ncbi:MAG: Stk1 family PASTA domain-containing Ser/Thr kinase [Microbacteriaceae bacterium]|nr:Stk1 family PASTA domain-containing Ser/Thr kinase [Microbacteriaceae bacterium]